MAQKTQATRSEVEAVRMAQRIRDNVSDWYDDEIDFEQFNVNAVALWAEAKAKGIMGDVTALVMPKL